MNEGSHQHIDYFFSLQSPWTYLGHQRLLDLAAQQRAEIYPWPVDFGKIFPATGGLPLPKRSPQRQAYRLMELRRWRDHLAISLNLQPRFFPCDEKLAARFVVAVREQNPRAALEVAGAILRAVWAEEHDISDPDTLHALASALDLDADPLLERARQAEIAQIIAQDSDAAIARGVFGAPMYAFQDELFWGQDRLDFLERALIAANH